MRAGLLVTVLLVAIAAGCRPNLTSGAYSCEDDSGCPSGWTCVGGRCFREVAGGRPCRIDLDCPDRNQCTLDICGALNRCTHEPEGTGRCDDNSFCNGPDACNAGSCEPVGMPPCAMDVCAPFGCPECGQVGFPCCPGEHCGAGATCNAGYCEGCGGSLGARCCEGDFCTGIGLACDPGSGTCVPCGSIGGACCVEFPYCERGAVCDGTRCNPIEACPGECPPDTTCYHGMCTPCRTEYTPCCNGSECNAGLYCSWSDVTCQPFAGCGEMDQPCCGGSPRCANPGLACVGSGVIVGGEGGGPEPVGETCLPCGSTGQPCCTEGPACANLTDACDVSGTCQPCGADSQPCCADGGCEASALACDPFANVCRVCGSPDGPCCGGMLCAGTGNVCLDSYCRLECGEFGEPCCMGALECVDTLSCISGRCG